MTRRKLLKAMAWCLLAPFAFLTRGRPPVDDVVVTEAWAPGGLDPELTRISMQYFEEIRDARPVNPWDAPGSSPIADIRAAEDAIADVDLNGVLYRIPTWS